MPSTSNGTSLRERASTQRNVTILTAILVAIPTAYGFRVWSGAEQGDFLLLLLLGVTVPTVYDDLWPAYDRTWKASSGRSVPVASSPSNSWGYTSSAPTRCRFPHLRPASVRSDWRPWSISRRCC